MEEAGFLRRHPWLVQALLVLLLLVLLAGLAVFLYLTDYSPPDFSVTVSSFEGLDRSSDEAATPPTFHVDLRVTNGNFLRHCFTEGSVVVDYDGVPLASADRLDEFCLPGRSVVVVPFVFTGGGLGLPDHLYERVRGGGVQLSVLVRLVRLDGDAVLMGPMRDGVRPMLLRCTATLDGRPSALCPRFLMVERGLGHE